jgi:hypothetical protein
MAKPGGRSSDSVSATRLRTATKQYRTGDYWQIPARTATGDVEWPTETDKDSQGNTVTVQIAKPPDGIEHHYAPLAVISVANGAVKLTGDCRKQFGPMAL